MLLLSVTYSSAKVNVQYNKIFNIYNKLIKASGARHKPLLVIINSSSTIAWNYGNLGETKAIYLPTGLINLMGGNSNKIAGILAHEIGHSILGHTKRPRKIYEVKNQELSADNYATNLVQYAGYNKCKTIKWIKVIQRKYGEGVSEGYPANSYRYKLMSGGDCK